MPQNFVSNLTSQLEQEKVQLEAIQSQINNLQEITKIDLDNYVKSVKSTTQRFMRTIQEIGEQAENTSKTVIIPMQETTQQILDWRSTVLQLMNEVKQALSTTMWRIGEVSTGLDSLTQCREKIQHIEHQLNQHLTDLETSHQAALTQTIDLIEMYYTTTTQLIHQKQELFKTNLAEHQRQTQTAFEEHLNVILKDVKTQYSLIVMLVLLLIMTCLLVYVSKETYSKNTQLAYLDSQVLQRQRDLEKYDYAIQDRYMKLMGVRK